MILVAKIKGPQACFDSKYRYVLDLMLSNPLRTDPHRTDPLVEERFVSLSKFAVPRCSLLLLVVPVVFAGCRDLTKPESTSGNMAPVQSLQWGGHTMGTTYRISVWRLRSSNPVDVFDQAILEQHVAKRLKQINQRMSTYQPDSELSMFNASAENQWYSVSDETADVVAAAIDYHKATDGALDVTIGPLMRIWGFNQEEPVKVPPKREQVQEVLTRVGSQYLRVRQNPGAALQKAVEGLEVDLSAIAKGYAVDQIVALLQQAGGEGGLVEIGGEVRAWGLRPDGRSWRVGIENPLIDKRMIAQIINLKDAALATSGDYRNFRSIESQEVCHLIDPVTGQPRPTGPMSVSVCAKTCMKSDALATALYLMGKDKGLSWSEKHNVAAMYLTVENGKIVKQHSSHFKSYIQ